MEALKKRLARLGLMVFVTWLCMELVTCVAGRKLRERGLFYEEQDASGLAGYLAARDPALGWPRSIDWGDGQYDALHSRLVPASPDVTVKPCLSIYGDSFAWSDEADAEHAWGNVLAQRAHCRVNNFGVGGYGTDQAYLRYVQHKDDKAPVVLLTHLSENVLRNVNRFRNLLSPVTRYGLKPRFIVDASGELALVPLFTPTSEADFLDMVRSPGRRLPHEYFAPGGPSGVSALSFPYTLSLARTLGSYKVRASFAGVPPHAAFYEPGHPADGLRVSAGIARAFQREALSRGAAPYVIFIPLPSDFDHRKKTGRWPYTTLVDELARTGVPHLDAGERLLAGLAGKSPCTLYSRCSGGHFTDDGYRIFGELVNDYLREQGKLP